MNKYQNLRIQMWLKWWVQLLLFTTGYNHKKIIFKFFTHNCFLARNGGCNCRQRDRKFGFLGNGNAPYFKPCCCKLILFLLRITYGRIIIYIMVMYVISIVIIPLTIFEMLGNQKKAFDYKRELSMQCCGKLF